MQVPAFRQMPPVPPRPFLDCLVICKKTRNAGSEGAKCSSSCHVHDRQTLRRAWGPQPRAGEPLESLDLAKRKTIDDLLRDRGKASSNIERSLPAVGFMVCIASSRCRCAADLCLQVIRGIDLLDPMTPTKLVQSLQAHEVKRIDTVRISPVRHSPYFLLHSVVLPQIPRHFICRAARLPLLLAAHDNQRLLRHGRAARARPRAGEENV